MDGKMEGITSLADALQQAAALLSDGNIPEAEREASSFLQVVLVGSSGAGKSAVANSIFGHHVLPTSDDSSTKCPVIIDVAKDGRGGRGVWGQMASRPPLTSPDEIRRAIHSEFGRWHMSKSRPSDVSVTLHSSTSPPLRIIDLPGLEAKGDAYAAEVARSNDSTILVVLPATSAPNAAASRAIKLAQDMDPEGVRSIGVITMADQAAADERALAAATWLVQGRGPAWTGLIPWVAVIGQPPKGGAGGGAANASAIDYDGTWRGEKETLRALLKVGKSEEARSIGRPALMGHVGNGIKSRLKQRVPTIMAGLNGRSAEVEEDLITVGAEVVGSSTGTRLLALELCRALEQKFHYQLDSSEVGGSRMVSTFEGTLPSRFRKLPLDEIFSFGSVKQIVLEADGYQPFLLSPEKGLRALIKKSLELAKQPGTLCVDEVHRILVESIASAASVTPLLGRYPPMKKELVHIASEALEEFRVQAKDMVVAIVDMERAFIPPSHFGKLVARRMEMLRRDEELRMEKAKKEDEAKALRAAQAREAEQKILNKATPPSSGTATPGRSPSPTGAQEMLAGYLWKQSKKGNKAEEWNRRWFVLNEKAGKLGYMKKPEDRAFRGTINLEDCIVEDIEDDASSNGSAPRNAPMRPGPGAPPPPPVSSAALSFKIRHTVSYKTVVKGHNALILKADKMEDKMEWFGRMRALTPASKEKPPPPPDASSSSSGGSQKKGLFERMGFSKDAPSSSPSFSDKELGKKRLDPDEDLRVMAQEVRDYVEAVLMQLSINIPKAIVLCQVEKAKATMLNKLYSAISSRPDSSIEVLLQEDGEVRAAREERKMQAEKLATLKRQLSMHEASLDDGSLEPGPGPNESIGGVEDWRVAFHEAGGGDSPDSVLDNPPTPPRPGGGPPVPPRPGMRASSSENDLYTTSNGNTSYGGSAHGGSPHGGRVRNPSRVPPPPPGMGYGY